MIDGANLMTLPLEDRSWTRAAICRSARTIYNTTPPDETIVTNLIDRYREGEGYLSLAHRFFRAEWTMHEGVARALVALVLDNHVDPLERERIGREHKSISGLYAKEEGLGMFRKGAFLSALSSAGIRDYNQREVETDLGMMDEQQYILRVLLEDRYQRLLDGKEKLTYGLMEKISKRVEGYFGPRSKREIGLSYFRWTRTKVIPWPRNLEHARELGLLK